MYPMRPWETTFSESNPLVSPAQSTLNIPANYEKKERSTGELDVYEKTAASKIYLQNERAAFRAILCCNITRRIEELLIKSGTPRRIIFEAWAIFRNRMVQNCVKEKGTVVAGRGSKEN